MTRPRHAMRPHPLRSPGVVVGIPVAAAVAFGAHAVLGIAPVADQQGTPTTAGAPSAAPSAAAPVQGYGLATAPPPTTLGLLSAPAADHPSTPGGGTSTVPIAGSSAAHHAGVPAQSVPITRAAAAPAPSMMTFSPSHAAPARGRAGRRGPRPGRRRTAGRRGPRAARPAGRAACRGTGRPPRRRTTAARRTRAPRAARWPAWTSASRRSRSSPSGTDRHGGRRGGRMPRHEQGPRRAGHRRPRPRGHRTRHLPRPEPAGVPAARLRRAGRGPGHGRRGPDRRRRPRRCTRCTATSCARATRTARSSTRSTGPATAAPSPRGGSPRCSAARRSSRCRPRSRSSRRASPTRRRCPRPPARTASTGATARRCPRPNRPYTTTGRALTWPLDVRYVDHAPWDFAVAPQARNRVWLRADGELPPPSDPRGRLLHACVLTYASDLTLLEAALLPHVEGGVASRQVDVASLDHAVWFHRPFRADHWLLYVQDSPNAGGGRGLATGRLYSARRDARGVGGAGGPHPAPPSPRLSPHPRPPATARSCHPTSGRRRSRIASRHPASQQRHVPVT